MMKAFRTKIRYSSSSVILFLLLTNPGRVLCESNLLTKFFTGYDKAIRPNFDEGKPLTVSVDLYVDAFGNIKEANMEYLIYGYFRQRWKDSRLAGRLNYTLTISGADIDKIWVPDPYCYNARESNMMMLDTQLHSRISVDPSGDVLYSKGCVKEYLIYGYFRQRWKDSRLAGRLNYTLTISGADIDNIWVPDPYCYNARESNMMMLDTQLHSRISVDPSGDVLYSKGVTLLASCDMNLRNFPLDSQNCCLKFGSYGYSTDHIHFEWGPAGVSVGNNEMAQFEYKGNKLSSGIDEYSVGNFSTVTVKFIFERRVGYYIIQVYLPDVFVVALSWIVFWMDKKEMGDRMALGITTILTIMFLLGSLNATMPRVSYPKALDWYLLVSFTFVFLSLIECMVVFILTLRSGENKDNSKYKLSSIPLSTMDISELTLPPLENSVNGNKEIHINGKAHRLCSPEKKDGNVRDDRLARYLIDSSYKTTAADRVDQASRFLFPVFFVIYNIVYWAMYALPEKKLEQTSYTSKLTQGEQKPTIVHCHLYVESFGNIEEANMCEVIYTPVCVHCLLSKDKGSPSSAGREVWWQTISKSSKVITTKEILELESYHYLKLTDLSSGNHNEKMTHFSLQAAVKTAFSIFLLLQLVTLLASCVMDLRNFPMDSQRCILKFGSYGYSTKDIVFKWIAGKTEVDVGNKEMAQFEYKGSRLTSGIDEFDTGNFSTMTATFSFERRIGYFLIQIYFPDIFVVVLSWTVFWMEKDDMGNRMALGFTTILTIMFLLGSLNGNLPKVSYAKALDWYLLVSFSFVFLSLIECMVVFLFASKAKQDETEIKYKKNDIPLRNRFWSSLRSVIGSNSPSSNSPNGGVSNIGCDVDGLEMVHRATKVGNMVVDDSSVQEMTSTNSKRMEMIADKIDRASRVIFPSIFILYNIFYWAYY
ncbi:Gamma-aminobutyric acid receptor subunit beta-1 [Stylophora pistillata]|uniref:Gamma-aminobutyric acid receptor subunit beta-1 n=1 Tax=Stylophora pistillata TaxID=50429 RepID=A0A2B4RZ72_STYPI|nr:Gamma-aminobutyric acid receptor subunit beta-1 [Stylophora pistillata]